MLSLPGAFATNYGGFEGSAVRWVWCLGWGVLDADGKVLANSEGPKATQSRRHGEPLRAQRRDPLNVCKPYLLKLETDLPAPTSCSNHPKAALIQPLSDSPSQRSRIGIAIAYWLRASIFKERVEILHPHRICNRTLISRGRSFYANLQTGSQQHKVKGHLLQDLACGVYVGRRS
jgi:hypothetical protein